MITKDSFGNDLPNPIFLKGEDSAKMAIEAIAISSFNLAISISMSKGYTVAYDKDCKSATITKPDGTISIISHEVYSNG